MLAFMVELIFTDMAPVIYHPFRKFLLRNIVYSTIAGVAISEAYWHLVAVPRVERRNFVMGLIEEERKLKQTALQLAEMELPSQGSAEED
jgi:hypothetical protein